MSIVHDSAQQPAPIKPPLVRLGLQWSTHVQSTPFETVMYRISPTYRIVNHMTAFQRKGKCRAVGDQVVYCQPFVLDSFSLAPTVMMSTD